MQASSSRVLAAVLAAAVIVGTAQAVPPGFYNNVSRALPQQSINPNFRITPNLSLNQYAYNTAVLGHAYAQVPPYALGYNPYTPAVSVNTGFPSMGNYGYNPYLSSYSMYSSSAYMMYPPNPYMMYTGSYGGNQTSSLSSGGYGSQGGFGQSGYGGPSSGYGSQGGYGSSGSQGGFGQSDTGSYGGSSGFGGSAGVFTCPSDEAGYRRARTKLG